MLQCLDAPMRCVIDTGDTFRSYDLGVMSPARYPCATPVTDVVLQCLDAPMRCVIDTGNRFRSCVLVVMSHARCPCAMPVTQAPFNVQLDLGNYVKAQLPLAASVKLLN